MVLWVIQRHDFIKHIHTIQMNSVFLIVHKAADGIYKAIEYLAIKADSAGIQLSVHAIGDAANGYLLDMMDRVNEHNGVKNRRFRLVHAQVIPDDFKRFKNMSIIAEVQPYHCTDDMRWMEERITIERCICFSFIVG